MNNPGRLLLVDGTAVMYRAFYAIRELSTDDGRPTNAIFGFIRMLRQMENAWQPSHWAVVFDGGLSDERLALLESYKAQRPSMPDPLRAQFAGVQDYLDRANVPWTRVEGEEADDVIASLAAAARAKAAEILIATSDKDLFQLVDGSCRIVPPAGKGGAMGEDDVLAKTGVPPSKIIDWLALVGDTSDNIPGVPGVGPKTAARLLADYGDLEGLWANLEALKSDKLRVALGENRAAVARNVTMVTLKQDLACPLSLGELAVREPDAARLLPFFEDFELHRMADALRQPELL